jgi:hypothetical protein
VELNERRSPLLQAVDLELTGFMESRLFGYRIVNMGKGTWGNRSLISQEWLSENKSMSLAKFLQLIFTPFPIGGVLPWKSTHKEKMPYTHTWVNLICSDNDFLKQLLNIIYWKMLLRFPLRKKMS